MVRKFYSSISCSASLVNSLQFIQTALIAAFFEFYLADLNLLLLDLHILVSDPFPFPVLPLRDDTRNKTDDGLRLKKLEQGKME